MGRKPKAPKEEVLEMASTMTTKEIAQHFGVTDKAIMNIIRRASENGAVTKKISVVTKQGNKKKPPKLFPDTVSALSPLEMKVIKLEERLAKLEAQRAPRKPSPGKKAPRQEEVLSVLDRPMTYAEVAEKLGCTVSSVRNAKANLLNAEKITILKELRNGRWIILVKKR